MNSKKVEKLLKKDSWTGKEVGQILMASLVNDMKHQRGMQTNEELFEIDLQTMERSLTTKQDMITYNVYADLFRSVSLHYISGRAYFHQFNNGYYHLLSALKQIKEAYKNIKTVEAFFAKETPSQLSENSLLKHFQTRFDEIVQEAECKELGEYVDKLIYPTLSYIYAYNALIGILEKIYDVEELKDTAVYGIEPLEDSIKNFNLLLCQFREDLKNDSASTEIVDKLFQPLQFEKFKPSPKVIEQIFAELKKQGFTPAACQQLRSMQALIGRLQYREST